MTRLGRLLGPLAGSVGVTLGNVVVGYVLTAALTRALGPKQFGTYTLVTSLIGVVVLPAQWGLPVLIVRETASAAVTGAWGPVKGLLRYAHALAAVVSAVAGLGLVGAWTLSTSLQAQLTASGVAAAAVTVPLTATAGIRGAMLRGLQRVVVGQLTEQLLRPGTLLVLVLAAPALATDVGTTLWLGVLASAVSAVVGYGLFLRLWPADTAIATAEYEVRAWLSATLPLGLTNGLNVWSSAAGVIVLGALRTPEEVGTYRVATQLALVGGIAYTSANAVLVPRFARAHAAKDPASMARAAVAAARITTAAAGVVCLGVAATGPAVFDLAFGPGYADARTAALLLLVGHVVNAAFGSGVALLNAGRHERVVTRVVVAATALGTVLTIVGAASLGGVGAALANLAFVVVLNASIWLRARALSGVDPSVFGGLRPGSGG